MSIVKANLVKKVWFIIEVAQKYRLKPNMPKFQSIMFKCCEILFHRDIVNKPI